MVEVDKKRKTYKTIDFSVLVASRFEEEEEKTEKHQDLRRELKKI